ncbi:Uu.00g007140.m01.CDS01 [Anthostomella pinea]|uniref:Uu.00g007140.m01.CDS01 n=1 Tax=Anthostomella pinea TaxID=933095 RepID=A0AAI8VXK2_9PEZI|nr:Uu.00g007140.m01.CDS01 [Anthostomella pinea]
MDGSRGANSPRQPKRRTVTAARKEQNKVAQRAYRKRQRELKQTVPLRPHITAPRRLEPRSTAEVLPDVADHLTGGHVPDVCSGDRPPCPAAEMPLEMPMAQVLADIEPLIHCGFPGPETSLTDIDLSLCLQTTVVPYTTAEEVCAPTIAAQETSLFPSFLDLSNLQDQETSTRIAVLTNAICLGIDISQLAVCAATHMSPFYRPTISPQQDPTALVASSTSGAVPPHLRPTLAQIMIPHHASLDLIPLPALRESAIMLSAAMPHLFDLWEMKLDIYARSALVCWRHWAGVSCHPWDMASWEVAPWFLRKWRMVVNGVGDGLLL